MVEVGRKFARVKNIPNPQFFTTEKLVKLEEYGQETPNEMFKDVKNWKYCECGLE